MNVSDRAVRLLALGALLATAYYSSCCLFVWLQVVTAAPNGYRPTTQLAREFGLHLAIAMEDGDVVPGDLVAMDAPALIEYVAGFFAWESVGTSDCLFGLPLVDGVPVDCWGKPYRIGACQRDEGSARVTFLRVVSSGPNRGYDGGEGDDVVAEFPLAKETMPRRASVSARESETTPGHESLETVRDRGE